MNSSGKVLILGASGGIGGEVARRLVADNWQVRALKRGAQICGPADGMQWIAGDALDGGQVAAAAAGCDVIVHAVNPPGYRHWRQQVLPMLRNTLQAAERQRALVVLPGTVYNYGPDAFPLIAEEAAQQPVTRKGAIRVAMELALKDYVQRGGRALIVRAGDFFGPRAGNNATLREMVEMHYLWRLPVRLRNDKLVDFLGAEPHTPLDSAVYQTLQGLGCLPAGAINQEAGEA
ncbi:hypothetical protein BXT92_16565 [Klebsiella pneumoniae]|nr:hypothetical protein BXT92_16565 [Klebsiella pneumoniae]